MDRNVDPDADTLTDDVSLSVRRAWIEIFDVSLDYKEVLVALRKESVDRNFDIRHTTSTRPRSLSVRRAWIEIILPPVDTSSVNGRSP